MRGAQVLPVVLGGCALAVLLGGCASARTLGDGDAALVDAAGDGPAVDAPADGPAIDGPVDGPVIDARIDARPIDAAVIDAAVDASVDAATDAAVDACVPTWTNLLGNPAFDGATVLPWTQTSTIIRTAAMMPFSPHTAPNAAEFGASNNANDVLVQTVTIPASATALRLRGFECHVTEDPIADADTFRVTVETPGGVVLETLRDITNSDVAPICVWLPFTWNATAAHAGQTVVLRFRGRTNLAFLTRFVVDSLALEVLACP